MGVLKQWLTAFVAISMMAGAVAQDDAVEAEQNLSEVRRKIESLEKKVRKANKRRGSAQEALRQSELAEAAARKRLAAIRDDLAATRKRIEVLERRVAANRASLDAYSEQLSEQLRLAYMTGREEWLRVILNQQDPVQISRQLVYYTYIARQRAGLMDEVRGKLESLRTARAAAAGERDRLEQLGKDQNARIEDLSAARQERTLALAAIDQDIVAGSGRLKVLQKEAEALASLVAELTRLLSDMPAGDAVPFAQRKGRMSRPVAGSIVSAFGQPRADGKLRWEGIMVAADAGAEVRAIHHGRVVYADWLPGMGLLMVVEHGDGFMSLYGHNQDLLKGVGEWVNPDTVIARVGDSGGRAETGLYFEIRKNGRPQDPDDWVK